MSVRKGDRNEGQLQVLNLMRVLTLHTVQKCRSEKIFPKNARWILCKPILDECIAATVCVRRANAVYVGEDSAAWRYRRNQQIEAHSHIDALLTLIDIAYNTFSIENDQMTYWISLCCEADEKLKAWMKSDKERFGNLTR